MALTDILIAIGLVLAIEGTLYALAPGAMLRALRAMQEMPEQTLRIGGVVALAVGVLVVWIAKG